ncbi:MAG: MaoC/PaaZ C-terminal domain-containing protein [Myxococcota bacterium]
MALNKDFIGKSYSPTAEWNVEAEHTMAYARATNTDNPAYLDEKRPGGIIAPPIYAVVFQFPDVAQPLFDSDLRVNMMRLVHGEQDMTFLRPVRPGDVIKTTATVKAITDKTSGELLDIGLESVNQKGEKVCDVVMGLFIKGRTGKRDAAQKAEDDARKQEGPPPGEPLFVASVDVAKDQSLRYADASGDHNPIHKDPEVAKAAGLPDIILHGLCTMAFVQNALVDKVAGGNPEKLKRIKARFAKPVLNGETLTIKAWKQEESADKLTLVVEAYNSAGVTVIKDGLAELMR